MNTKKNEEKIIKDTALSHKDGDILFEYTKALASANSTMPKYEKRYSEEQNGIMLTLFERFREARQKWLRCK